MSSLYRSILNAQGSSFASTNSFTFDGQTDYINCGNGANFNTNDTISLSAWFKTSADTTPLQTIFSKQYWRLQLQDFLGGSRLVWTVYHTTTQLRQIYTPNGTEYADGQWHHVLCTYKSNTIGGMTMYVDDDLIGSVNTETQIQTSGLPFLIGGRTTSLLQPINGNIDEVAFWNSDQSSNVSTIYNSGVPNDLSSLSPLSWWRMGEAANYAGGQWTLTDQGSGGNDGTSLTIPAPPAQPSTDVPT